MTLPLIGPPIPPGYGKTFSLIGAWPSWQSTSLAVNGKSVIRAICTIAEVEGLKWSVILPTAVSAVALESFNTIIYNNLTGG
jgi:hypothetical protein